MLDDDDLFVKDGAPVKFCFHRSVRQGRGQITRDVERHGGQIVADERTANVLLVDEEEDIAFLRRRYYSSTERYRLSIYVEPRGFVQACIRSGTYEHVGPIRQGMPGRAPGRGGRSRVAFTPEDRDHLAYYIATRCPTRDGRMGNSAYKDLERLGQTDDEYWKWARRHTWHSWREHYKTRPQIMDPLIEHYVQRLKNEGHHFGQDLRSHDYRNLRRELAEEEDDDDDDEQREGIERQEERGRQAPAPRRRDQARRDYLARHEGELVIMEEEEDVVIVEPQRVERQALDREATREITPEGNMETQESEEIEGSDLFGDREYVDYDNHGVEYPGPGQDGPPPSTQATLVASPRFAEKERTSASITRPRATIEERAQMPPPSPSTVPPSSQVTLVMGEEHGMRIPIRGASAEPGPSMPREKRARSAAAVNAPLRNTRARSRSVEPQFQPRREDEGGNGERKIKEEVLMEEDIRIEEERGAGHVSVIGGISTVEDEMAVEGLLEASVEDDEDTDEASDGDFAGLPRYEEIEVTDSEPSDSDDKETHGSLVRGAEPRSEEEQDEEDEDEEDEDDAERIKRMASGKLVAAPAPTPPEPRVTRSKTVSQISPRKTRSATQRTVPTFPSEYAPPQGTRAARVVRGRARWR